VESDEWAKVFRDSAGNTITAYRLTPDPLEGGSPLLKLNAITGCNRVTQQTLPRRDPKVIGWCIYGRLRKIETFCGLFEFVALQQIVSPIELASQDMDSLATAPAEAVYERSGEFQRASIWRANKNFPLRFSALVVYAFPPRLNATSEYGSLFMLGILYVLIIGLIVGAIAKLIVPGKKPAAAW
jgi:hypothetical protein